MLEGDSAARELLDALIEVVAFEVDGRGRDDFFIGVDLHREGNAARGFETGIAVFRTIHDLGEPKPAVEVDRALVIGAGDRHLVESRTRTDVEPDVDLADRSCPPA